MLVKVALLVFLYSLQVILGVLDDFLDVVSKGNYIGHLTLGSHNNINRQTNLFPIYHFKWRVASALCHS